MIWELIVRNQLFYMSHHTVHAHYWEHVARLPFAEARIEKGLKAVCGGRGGRRQSVFWYLLFVFVFERKAEEF